MKNIIKLVKNHCFEENNNLEIKITDFITIYFWKNFRTNDIYATVRNGDCKIADYLKLKDLKKEKTKRFLNEADIDYSIRLKKLLFT